MYNRQQVALTHPQRFNPQACHRYVSMDTDTT